MYVCKGSFTNIELPGRVVSNLSSYSEDPDPETGAILNGFLHGLPQSFPMIEWLLNNELERMWKEAVVAIFKVLSRQGQGKPMKNLGQLFSGPEFELSTILPPTYIQIFSSAPCSQTPS
jgi:hypothetical protein